MAPSTPSEPLSRRRRRRVFDALTAVALTAATAGVAGALPATAASTAPSTAKGPIGWDTLRHLDQFATLPQGVQLKQFSSFDRAQRNNDQSNCLRTIGNGGCVRKNSSELVFSRLSGG